MAKLLDSEGKLWALMSSKDKAGRIYICLLYTSPPELLPTVKEISTSVKTV